MTRAGGVAARVARLPFDDVAASLDAKGFALLGPLLTPTECARVAALYSRDALFRSRVVMARHGFGRGEYRYFAYPLPEMVATLRAALYPPLATVANAWHERLGGEVRYPGSLDEWLARCHAAGQTRPTPLLLRYAAGDWNCLHQDLYGPLVFPIQVAILLSAPGRDFTGGELVLTEQRPRQQSRASVVPLAQGEAVTFAVRDRPVRRARAVLASGSRRQSREEPHDHRPPPRELALAARPVLLEELAIPYEIRRYARDPKTMLAPPELRAVHPLGKSPVIGDGRLKPAAGTPERVLYLYWMHYAEGSVMPPLIFKAGVRRDRERADAVLREALRARSPGARRAPSSRRRSRCTWISSRRSSASASGSRATSSPPRTRARKGAK